jgi:hypothetical protein
MNPQTPDNEVAPTKTTMTPPEEPVIKESLTTEPALDWRELLPDEVPQVGDEWYSNIGKRWVTSIGSSGEKVSRFGGIRFRTRRPLPDPVPTQPPTQNEWREEAR